MNPLTLKLEHFVRMSPADRGMLDTVASGQPRRFAAREQIVREGEAPRHVHLVLSGWACRLKRLQDGRRQIVGFLLPGDLCDANVCILRKMDHTIGTLSAVTARELPHELMQDVARQHPRIARALWMDTLANASIQREWMIGLGQRTASERVAHLLCELFLRLQAVGMTTGPSCELAPTQADVGEAVGLSTVHVNRTLQELRAAGLIVLRGRQLAIPDLDGLKRVAMFDASYLHLDREDSVPDAGAV